MSLVLASVYRVPGLSRACTVHSCVIREGFRLRVNLQKTRVHGCVHAIRAILNACTVLAIIKFKSSCTVHICTYIRTEHKLCSFTICMHNYCFICAQVAKLALSKNLTFSIDAS